MTFLDAGGKPSSAEVLGRHNVLPQLLRAFQKPFFLMHDFCAVCRFSILKFPRIESLLYFTNFR